MKLMGLALISILTTAHVAQAEVIQVPEDCLALQSTPCLMRASQNELLKIPNSLQTLHLGPRSIIKITQIDLQFEVELLDGTLFFEQNLEKLKSAKLNGITVPKVSFFASREGARLKILNSSKFLLSEYDLGLGREGGHELAKIDFLNKKDLISYLAPFFAGKRSLVEYLKSHEAAWRREFTAQNSTQTKVLRRSIASVEEDEKQLLARKIKESQDIKKVRETFFYRTFYR
ncbi:MAG: hypothetical protein H7061_12290 [Bdellovibrionaceae bacterium]|nr:hypothetical protein [Bdellovibrio sp.]